MCVISRDTPYLFAFIQHIFKAWQSFSITLLVYKLLKGRCYWSCWLDIVDTVMSDDDIDNDGYLTYPEYIIARRRAEAQDELEEDSSSSSSSSSSETRSWDYRQNY